jgi:two-component system sensor histidine kinase KdpD
MVIWTVTLGLVTVALLAIRGSLERVHVALGYLLLVLVASSRSGRALGLALSVAAFLAFNFFFLPPFYTFAVADPRDWFVLAAFLVTSLVAAQLLARSRGEAAAAELRASEVERLSALGAETLNAGRAEDAMFAIAEVIRAALGALRCEIYGREDSGGALVLLVAKGTAPRTEVDRPFGQPSDRRLAEWVADHGASAVELPDGAIRGGDASSGDGLDAVDLTDARALLLPLIVRQGTVGVLRIVAAKTLSLDTGQRHFLEALAYYAALGVERRRLAAHAERVDVLKKADEVKNALLASVSHDLRTPLTTIKALAHDIAVDGDERAVTIEEETDRLNRFVADLLDLSRIAGGALQVAPEINAIEDLIGAAVQRVGGAIGDRVLAATLDPTEPILLGRFDFVHSVRILTNLLENAAKYSPQGSTIDLRVRRVDATVEVVVADRGPGVPEDQRDRIFEPFHRSAGASPDVAGVGLGLSIARGLAEAQGGSIRYEPREGGGSVFVLCLPAADIAELEVDATTAKSL